MQLVFLTTHLPSYLAICGMDPMLSAPDAGHDRRLQCARQPFFGWAGERWNKLALLGAHLYSRGRWLLAWYFMLPPSPATTLLFGALMGFLWMGVGPRVRGAVAEMFGLAMAGDDPGARLHEPISSQLPRRLWRRLIYDQLGSYTMAWRIGVALGARGRHYPGGVCADAAVGAAMLKTA